MAAKPGKKQLVKDVTDALAAHDAQGVLAALDKGLDADWHDAQGRGLLHYAAAWGDDALVDTLLSRGAPALLRDKSLDSAQDTAAAYGHDKLAKKFAAAMVRERATEPQKPLPYKSLQDIRDASAKDGVDHFHRLAREGRFCDVIKLAAQEGKTGKGLTAQDLLGRGPEGDATIYVLAAAGALPELMKTDIWMKNAGGFQTLWQQVPAACKEGLDAARFMRDLRQARLESYTQPRLKGRNAPPKGPK